MPRVSDEYKRERIHSLYTATWACIARAGLDHLTLDDVLAESGYSAGTVYNYFGGRDELVDAAIDAALTELGDALDGAASAPTDAPSELFVAVLDAFERKAVEEPFAMATASVFMSSRPPLQEPHAQLALRYRQFSDQVEVHASRWQELGSVGTQATPEAIAELMISLIMGYFSQSPLMRTNGRDGHLAALAALSNVPGGGQV